MRWIAVTWTMCFCWGAAKTNLFAAEVWHFLDAEGAQRLQAGKPIDTRWFDY